MTMLLLVGVSIGFALSVLTVNNFYANKAFTAGVNLVKSQIAKLIPKQNTQQNR
jgi:hypothetical protein